MEIIWWEKTVEYFFIQKYVDLNMLIAPLDGNHEKVGDAVFSNKNNWVLIEFKRNKSSIKDEQNKFSNYSKAHSLLSHKDQHHLIIYGSEMNQALLLKCQRYFSNINIEVENALKGGVPRQQFVEYLDDISRFKKNNGESTGGYSLVAGISSDGKVTQCMSTLEFAQVMNLKKEIIVQLEKEKQISLDNSGPEFGM